VENTAIIPTMKRAPLTGLPASVFQHPLDRQATENLKKIKGFDWLVKKVLEYGIERIEYVNHIGGAIRIGPKQMSRNYAMLLECCSILDAPEPELYAQQGGVNAYTSGHTHPFIILDMANSNATHPFPVERARAIDEWVNSPEYNNILAGNYPSSSQMTKTISCPTCKQIAEHGTKFCNTCGTPLATH